MTDERDIWFPAKRYGWGWGFPITLQGWLVFIGYILLLILGVVAFLYWQSAWMFIAYTVAISVLFVMICYRKGERPRWRWGE